MLAHYVTCQKKHKVFVVWSEERKCFAFTCDVCQEHSEIALSIYGPVQVKKVEKIKTNFVPTDRKGQRVPGEAERDGEFESVIHAALILLLRREGPLELPTFKDLIEQAQDSVIEVKPSEDGLKATLSIKQTVN